MSSDFNEDFPAPKIVNVFSLAVSKQQNGNGIGNQSARPYFTTSTNDRSTAITLTEPDQTPCSHANVLLNLTPSTAINESRNRITPGIAAKQLVQKIKSSGASNKQLALQDPFINISEETINHLAKNVNCQGNCFDCKKFCVSSPPTNGSVQFVPSMSTNGPSQFVPSMSTNGSSQFVTSTIGSSQFVSSTNGSSQFVSSTNGSSQFVSSMLSKPSSLLTTPIISTHSSLFVSKPLTLTSSYEVISTPSATTRSVVLVQKPEAKQSVVPTSMLSAKSGFLVKTPLLTASPTMSSKTSVVSKSTTLNHSTLVTSKPTTSAKPIMLINKPSSRVNALVVGNPSASKSVAVVSSKSSSQKTMVVVGKPPKPSLFHKPLKTSALTTKQVKDSVSVVSLLKLCSSLKVEPPITVDNFTSLCTASATTVGNQQFETAKRTTPILPITSVPIMSTAAHAMYNSESIHDHKTTQTYGNLDSLDQLNLVANSSSCVSPGKGVIANRETTIAQGDNIEEDEAMAIAASLFIDPMDDSTDEPSKLSTDNVESPGVLPDNQMTLGKYMGTYLDVSIKEDKLSETTGEDGLSVTVSEDERKIEVENKENGDDVGQSDTYTISSSSEDEAALENSDSEYNPDEDEVMSSEDSDDDEEAEEEEEEDNNKERSHKKLKQNMDTLVSTTCNKTRTTLNNVLKEKSLPREVVVVPTKLFTTNKVGHIVSKSSSNNSFSSLRNMINLISNSNKRISTKDAGKTASFDVVTWLKGSMSIITSNVNKTSKHSVAMDSQKVIASPVQTIASKHETVKSPCTEQVTTNSFTSKKSISEHLSSSVDMIKSTKTEVSSPCSKPEVASVSKLRPDISPIQTGQQLSKRFQKISRLKQLKQEQQEAIEKLRKQKQHLNHPVVNKEQPPVMKELSESHKHSEPNDSGDQKRYNLRQRKSVTTESESVLINTPVLKLIDNNGQLKSSTPTSVKASQPSLASTDLRQTVPMYLVSQPPFTNSNLSPVPIQLKQLPSGGVQLIHQSNMLTPIISSPTLTTARTLQLIAPALNNERYTVAAKVRSTIVNQRGRRPQLVSLPSSAFVNQPLLRTKKPGSVRNMPNTTIAIKTLPNIISVPAAKFVASPLSPESSSFYSSPISVTLADTTLSSFTSKTKNVIYMNAKAQVVPVTKVTQCATPTQHSTPVSVFGGKDMEQCIIVETDKGKTPIKIPYGCELENSKVVAQPKKANLITAVNVTASNPFMSDGCSKPTGTRILPLSSQNLIKASSNVVYLQAVNTIKIPAAQTIVSLQSAYTTGTKHLVSADASSRYVNFIPSSTAATATTTSTRFPLTPKVLSNIKVNPGNVNMNFTKQGKTIDKAVNIVRPTSTQPTSTILTIQPDLTSNSLSLKRTCLDVSSPTNLQKMNVTSFTVGRSFNPASTATVTSSNTAITGNNIRAKKLLTFHGENLMLKNKSIPIMNYAARTNEAKLALLNQNMENNSASIGMSLSVQTTLASTLAPHTSTLAPRASTQIAHTSIATNISVVPSRITGNPKSKGLALKHGQILKLNGQHLLYLLPNQNSNQKAQTPILPKSVRLKMPSTIAELTRLTKEVTVPSLKVKTPILSSPTAATVASRDVVSRVKLGSVPIQLGVYDKLFCMSGKKRKKCTFLPDVYDRKFLSLFGLELCMNELRQSYFNFKKGAHGFGIEEHFSEVSQNKRKPTSKLRPCRIKKLIEVVCSEVEDNEDGQEKKTTSSTKNNLNERLNLLEKTDNNVGSEQKRKLMDEQTNPGDRKRLKISCVEDEQQNDRTENAIVGEPASSLMPSHDEASRDKYDDSTSNGEDSFSSCKSAPDPALISPSKLNPTVLLQRIDTCS